VTHDTSERLSYYLFAAVSDRRPNYERGRRNMKATCLKCHTNPRVLQFYAESEGVVRSTNQLVREAERIIQGLRREKRLTPEPFDEPIEFLYFNLWHYGGRTAKHGAFMGGADFVQWHGYYEVVSKLAELKKAAAELRQGREQAEAAKTAEPRGRSEGESHAPSTAR
jgi:hydroxylamine dehydrogenase